MKKVSARQKRVAEAVVLEGKSFKASALENGYSEYTARKGARVYMSASPGMESAFIQAAQKAELDSAMMAKVSQHRLFSSIVEGKACENVREIEVLGRFKNTDWFVRNSDIQIGIFAGLADDTKTASKVDELKNLLPTENKE